MEWNLSKRKEKKKLEFASFIKHRLKMNVLFLIHVKEASKMEFFTRLFRLYASSSRIQGYKYIFHYATGNFSLVMRDRTAFHDIFSGI